MGDPFEAETNVSVIGVCYCVCVCVCVCVSLSIAGIIDRYGVSSWMTLLYVFALLLRIHNCPHLIMDALNLGETEIMDFI